MINNMPLDTFRKILGYNPYHFWGLSNATVPINSKCNTSIKKYGWQIADGAGRSDIRDAIATAENRLFEYLGYRVGPRWVEKELIFPRPQEAGLQYTMSEDIRGRWLSMDIQEGYIQDVGQIAYTTLDDAANVTYTDEYGDGVTDTATITVNLTGFDPQPTADEIAVFYTDTDRLDSEDKDNWEIRPIKASISGTTLTIIARSWMFANPVLYEGVSHPDIDPNDTAGSFVGKVEVYRRYTKKDGITTDDSQAIIIWESDPPPWANCSDVTYSNTNRYDPYATGTAIGRVNVRDRRLGYLGPAWVQYNTDTGEFVARSWQATQPDRVIIRYKAGADRDEINGRLPGGSWDQVVARLAMVELTRRICACDKANRELWKWQTDLSQTGGNNDVSFQATTAEQLNNPLGTARGAVYAWNQVKNLMLYKATIV